MNFVRLLRASCSRLHMTQRRNVSEYSKKFGYKAGVRHEPEAKIKPLNIAACLAITSYIVYDISRDRKEHLQVFLDNYEEGKTYYNGHRTMDFTSKVDMSFLSDKYDPKPTGEEGEVIQNRLGQPMRPHTDKPPRIDTEDRTHW